MKVLIACEFSGIVRDAFFDHGHDAWSVDLVRSDVPGKHIIGDVLDVLDEGWDMMLAFPPCTYLARSGAWRHSGSQRQAEALEFTRVLMDAPIPRIAVENPVGAINSHIRKPDQIIHPWQFGHPEPKATCLWLKNLPLLVPGEIVTPGESRILAMPSSLRRKNRSRTYPKIADAMARQWGYEE